MFKSAPRNFSVKVSSTGENVGPTTYVICNPRNLKQYCAPFMSNTPQNLPLAAKLNTDALYDIRNQDINIKGGLTLQNKAKRFRSTTDDDNYFSPIPDLLKSAQCIDKKPKLGSNKARLYVCSVPYSKSVTAPSIPTKIDENGYDISKDGTLIKVPQDRHLKTKQLNIMNAVSSKGSKWASRTSRRFCKSQYVTLGPGPAAYFKEHPKCRKTIEDEEFREMARLFSFLPRYIEGQELKAAKEKTPGPGSYEIGKSRIYPSLSIHPQPFISAKERFYYTTSSTPSPTDYNVCNTAKQKQFSTKCVPFGFQASRFLKKDIVKIPGPADYDIKGSIEEAINRKSNKNAIFHAPFYQTSKKTLSFINKEAFSNPSPSDYFKNKTQENETSEIYSSVFANTVERFSYLNNETNSTDPAAYNVSTSFNKNRSRKSHNVGTVPFNSSGLRSKTPVVRYNLPCPTSYETGCHINGIGFHFAKSPRFKAAAEGTPGPGHYEVDMPTSKAYKTYNLTLKENVLQKRIRLAPRETRKRWFKEIGKKKLLSCFDAEPDYEDRMIQLICTVFDKPL